MTDDEFKLIIEKIKQGQYTDADLEKLFQALINNDNTQFSLQLEKFNLNIGEGKKIHIGDRIYYQWNEEAIKVLVNQIQSENMNNSKKITSHLEHSGSGDNVNGNKIINNYYSSSDIPNLDINWQEMSQVMLEEYQRLTTNPLTFGEGIFYDKSDRVYVPLGLVERKKKPRSKKDVSPEEGSQLYQETEITQTFANTEFLEQVIKQGKSRKSQGKRIAIIGEPGAGKTTLLQQVAQWIINQIEDVIVIWISLADLQGQELETYLTEKWLQAVIRQHGQAEVSPQIKNDFLSQFKQKQVWLLLDGVDEMQTTSGSPLSDIARQVRIGGLLSQTKIILTCRLNLWDGNSNLLDTFDTYRTLDFSYPEQVEQFINNWFDALSSTEENTADKLCNALKQEGKERIRDLVKNPLRLTLLCFNCYLGEGNLPDTKAGLYEQFVDDFYEWKKEQFVTTGKQRKELNGALGELAKEAIDQEETRFRLRQEFVCEYLGEPDDEDSLFSLALNLGWLNKVGVDVNNPRKTVYAFFHPSFQEYFASLVIDDWHYFLNHIPDNPNHPDASYRIFKPQWQEVITLWSGRINIPQNIKEKFINELIEFEDNCGHFYRIQAYLLAGVVISEFSVNKNYVDIILDKLIKAGFQECDDKSKDKKRFPNAISKSAREVLERSYHPKTKEKLLKLLQKTTNEKEKEKVAKTILLQCPGNQEALRCLIKLFNTSTDDKLIQIILKDFEKLDLGDLKLDVEKILNNFLEASLDIYFIGYPENTNAPKYLKSKGIDIFQCLNVIEALICIQSKPYSISSELLKSFLNDNRLDIQSTYLIAEKLLTIDDKNTLAIKALEGIYQSNIPDESRYWAFFSLHESNSDRINFLSELINTPVTLDEAINIAEALLKIDPKHKKALDFLHGLFDETNDDFYCFYCAEVLLKYNPESEKAIDVLFDLLKSEKVDARRYTAQILGKTYLDCKEVVDVLLNDLFSQDEDKRIFPFPETCLGNLQLQSLLPDVIKKLRECLEQSSGYVDRGACYDSLWSYATKTPYPIFYNAWHSKSNNQLKSILFKIFSGLFLLFLFLYLRDFLATSLNTQ